jgi:hypothetical protein
MPNKEVTRAEFVTMVVNAFKLEDYGAKINFKDVKATDWHYKSVSSAVKAGIIKGYEDNTFKPHKNITRQEMSYIMGTVMEKIKNKHRPTNTEQLLAQFKDKDKISNFAKEAIGMSKQYGIMDGYKDGLFLPLKNSTRAEASAVIYRIFTAESS